MIDKFRDHAANERTFLAWIRSAIAIAGFGILIEKMPGTPDGSWAGFALVGLSAALVALASVRFMIVRRQIARAREVEQKFAIVEALFGAMLALLMMAVMVFLLGLVAKG